MTRPRDEGGKPSQCHGPQQRAIQVTRAHDSRRGGVGGNSKKTTHNSVVEASLFANECFVPENRDEFHAHPDFKKNRHN